MTAPLRCRNSEPGWFNQECGRPATWIGRQKKSGHEQTFCDDCKENGWEASPLAAWVWRRVEDEARADG